MKRSHHINNVNSLRAIKALHRMWRNAQTTSSELITKKIYIPKRYKPQNVFGGIILARWTRAKRKSSIVCDEELLCVVGREIFDRLGLASFKTKMNVAWLSQLEGGQSSLSPGYCFQYFHFSVMVLWHAVFVHAVLGYLFLFSTSWWLLVSSQN